MTEIFGVPTQALFGQLLIGLINGSFYALLSLGLAVIFGLLNIINFTHGAQYMMGAFAAWFLLNKAGLGYWWALVLAPVIVGITGVIIEARQRPSATEPPLPAIDPVDDEPTNPISVGADPAAPSPIGGISDDSLSLIVDRTLRESSRPYSIAEIAAKAGESN